MEKANGGPEVKKLISTNFPKVRVIYGTVNANKETDSPEVNQAVATADLMIHGSGPLLVGADNLALWLKATKKLFGIFGTTLQSPGPYHLDILKKAAFIYTRETLSIEHLKKAGLTSNHIQFAPTLLFTLLSETIRWPKPFCGKINSKTKSLFVLFRGCAILPTIK